MNRLGWVLRIVVKVATWAALVFVGFGNIFAASSLAIDTGSISLEPWQQIGLGGGGTFQAIGFSPVPNNTGTYTIFLGGDTLGLYKSVNNGVSWTPANTGLYDYETSKILVNSANPNTVYLATHGGFYKSTDGGSSWKAKNYGRSYSTNGVRNNMLASMAYDPTNPNTIYIGTGYLRNNGLPPDNATQIYKSTDGGETWGSGAIYASTGLLVYDLAVNPNNSRSVYAALGYKSTGRLLHSTDGGVTWTSVDSNTAHVYYGLAFDKNHNLFASGWDGSLASSGQCGPGGSSNASAMRVIKLNDTTGTITDITPSRTATSHLNSTCRIALSPANELYVTDNVTRTNTVWRCPAASTCQTSAWVPVPTMGRLGWLPDPTMRDPVWALGISPDNSAWVGTSMKLYRYNSNHLWDEQYSQQVTGGYKTRGNENTVITARDMIFINSNEYYFGPADIYIEGTKDKGASFFQVKFPDPNYNMNDSRVLVADAANANIWYVVTHLQDQKTAHGKLLRKDQTGVWTTKFTSCLSSSSCPFSPATVTNGGGIIDVYARGSLILASTYNDGVYRSADGGNSWTKVSSLGVSDVYKFAESANKIGQIMAAASSGMWLSADAGATWSKQSTFPATYAEAVVWAGANTWYSSSKTKIYKTADNGATWTLVYTWTGRPDIFTAVLPSGEDIAVGMKSSTDPNANPVCASFNLIANYDHLANGGLACSVSGGGSGTWQQIDMDGVLMRGHGVEFNPYDPDELFYLSYGAGAYRTRLLRGSTIKAGDADGDGLVNETDYQVWLAHFNQLAGNGYRDGDFNADGKVDGIDFVIWLTNTSAN